MPRNGPLPFISLHQHSSRRHSSEHYVSQIAATEALLDNLSKNHVHRWDLDRRAACRRGGMLRFLHHLRAEVAVVTGRNGNRGYCRARRTRPERIRAAEQELARETRLERAPRRAERAVMSDGRLLRVLNDLASAREIATVTGITRSAARQLTGATARASCCAIRPTACTSTRRPLRRPGRGAGFRSSRASQGGPCARPTGHRSRRLPKFRASPTRRTEHLREEPRDGARRDTRPGCGHWRVLGFVASRHPC